MEVVIQNVNPGIQNLKKGKAEANSPYRIANLKVEELKQELRNRNLSVAGKKEDLLRRLERYDQLRSSKPDYASWKVVELKEELQNRNVSDVGNKELLIQRLEEYDRIHGTPMMSRTYTDDEEETDDAALTSPAPTTLSFDSPPASPSSERTCSSNSESPLASPIRAPKNASPAPSSPSSSRKKKIPTNMFELLVDESDESDEITIENGDDEPEHEEKKKKEKSQSPKQKQQQSSKAASPKEKPQSPSKQPEEREERREQEEEEAAVPKPTLPSEPVAAPKQEKKQPMVIKTVSKTQTSGEKKSETAPQHYQAAPQPNQPNQTAPVPNPSGESAAPKQEKKQPMVVKTVPKNQPSGSGGSSENPSENKPEEITRMEERHANERDHMHLFRRPFFTLKHFFLFIFEHLFSVVKHYLTHAGQLFLIIAAIGVVLAAVYIEGPHTPHMKVIEKFVFWYGGWYGGWVVLGIASSFGIGSGLHTFILYLGPFIAQATVKAYACGSNDISVAEDSNIFSIDLACNHPPPAQPILYLEILQLINIVKWESFCWGAGTAIGELPPYFLAKAAALAGEKVEGSEVFAEIKHEKDKSLTARVQAFCVSIMKSTGFFGILLLASVPNPLFDLAGIFSGYLKYPFWKFFGATLIGKAVIKVSLQTLFIVIIFSKPSFELLLEYVHYVCHIDFVHNLNPKLFDVVTEVLDKTKAKYENPDAEDNQGGNIFSTLFTYFFYVVMMVCLISIIQSFAQVQLRHSQRKELEKLERELERKKAH